jgi:hypothetical protein
MPVRTAAGTKVYIGPATTEATDTVAEFSAITWTEIGGVTALPEYGDESAAVTSTDLGTARVRKGKGARDAGTATLTVNNDPADAGQQALVTAEGTNFVYPFRVVYPDRPAPGGTDTEEFFRGIVRSKRRGGGDVNSVMTRVFIVDVDSQIYEKPATTGV